MNNLTEDSLNTCLSYNSGQEKGVSSHEILSVCFRALKEPSLKSEGGRAASSSTKLMQSHGSGTTLSLGVAGPHTHQEQLQGCPPKCTRCSADEDRDLESIWRIQNRMDVTGVICAMELSYDAAAARRQSHILGG